MAVMSEAKHLSLSVTGEDEILRLSPQDDMLQSQQCETEIISAHKNSSREI